MPESLANFLNKKVYDAPHTLDLPEKNRTKDAQIARKSTIENRIVASKDTDFLESFILRSEPKKLIFTRTGNIPNKQPIHLFEQYLSIIAEMISRSNLVEINQKEIAEHD